MRLRISFAVMLTFVFAWRVRAGQIDHVAHDIPYRHQLNTATCWVHCGISTLDLQGSEILGHPVSFSADALILNDIRSRALDVYLGHETPWDPGAGMTRLYAMALEHGIVPESIWKSRLSLVENYEKIFLDVERLVRFAKREEIGQSEFLHRLDLLLTRYVGTFPPEDFVWEGHSMTARGLARRIVNGDSMAYEFRPIPYNGHVFGLVGETAWTHIISRKGELKPIRSVVGKKTILMANSSDALNVAAEIFAQHRPLFLTFITNDGQGQSTYGVNSQGEYFVRRPLGSAYAGSHFVLVTGLERNEAGEITGLLIRDSVTKGVGDERERYMSRAFFDALGKTVHTIGLPCERELL